MKKPAGYLLGTVAIAFIPVAMYLALAQGLTFTDPAAAFRATLGMLLFDALLFFVAFGAWHLTRWERCGLSILLPLLLVMASWAAMMGMVTTKMATVG